MDEKGVYAEVHPDVRRQSPSRVRMVSTWGMFWWGCWSMSRGRKVSEQGAGLLCDTKVQLEWGKHQGREWKHGQNCYGRRLYTGGWMKQVNKLRIEWCQRKWQSRELQGPIPTQNRIESPEINHIFMVNWFSPRVPRLFNGERIVSSLIVLGQLYIHMQKNKVGPLPHTIYKKLTQNGSKS